MLKGRLIDIPMLDEDDCIAVVQKMNELEHRWITRAPGTFYTLGRATYMDIQGAEPSDGAFHSRLKSDNFMLRSNFRPLYQRLCAVLGDVLGSPPLLTTQFALPGFHIFRGAGVAIPSAAPPHFDMQYRMLDWDGNRNEAEPISFTLPIRLPRVGGGLEVWPDSPDQMEARFRRGELKKMSECPAILGPGHIHRYDVGCLTVHMDRVLHRIGYVGEADASEQRITFQGHGRKLDGVWHLYW